MNNELKCFSYSLNCWSCRQKNLTASSSSIGEVSPMEHAEGHTRVAYFVQCPQMLTSMSTTEREKIHISVLTSAHTAYELFYESAHASSTQCNAVHRHERNAHKVFSNVMSNEHKIRINFLSTEK
jgi:hypothetical protein